MKMRSQAVSPRAACATVLFLMLSLALISSPGVLAQAPNSLLASISSPPSGALVRATITVKADVTVVGSATVAGVQFKLDGANLGAEDALAPYEISWNTATASNGAHTLTAVARDLLGVTYDSDPVPVTVDNLRPTVTINQATAQADPSNASPINFTVVFSEPVSGFTTADVTISGTAGGNKTVALTGGPSTFNAAVSGMTSGTVIATIAANVATDAAGNGNIASISTDNAVTFDAIGPTVTINQAAGQPDPTNASPIRFTVVFSEPVVDFLAADVTITGTAGGTTMVALSGGPSTYGVAVSGMTDGTVIATLAAGAARDAAGNASAASTSTDHQITFTATARRFEDTDLAIVYTPGTTLPGQPMDWWHGSRSREWSGGTAAFDRSPGARASLTFTGTSIRWIGFRAPWTGIANVFLDGSLITTVDLYSTVEQVQVTVFAATGLSAGNHTIVVESTGQKNSAAWDWAVVVDAFDVTPSSPPTTSGTRVEETAASLTYTAGWTLGDTGNPWSGGTAAFSATGGAQATVFFVGTSVDWVGLRGPGTGIALVYLDGAFQAEVDTYSPVDVQDVFYTARDLAPAGHMLTVLATGDHRPAATNSLIFVDAFDMHSRFEETEPSVTYSGSWTHGETGEAFSGSSPTSGTGTAALSETASAQATFAFTGTSVKWLGSRGPTRGIARVFLDGALMDTVDTFAPVVEPQAALFSATGLADTTHTLVIEATGLKNSSATYAWIVVDAFDVTLSTPAPLVTRRQESDPLITYTADWALGNRFNLRSGENARTTSTAMGQATFTFSGTTVRWVSETGFGGGIARVYLDSVFVTEVDTYAPMQEEFQKALFTATNLAPGSHTLTIEATGLKNPASSGTQIVVDAFDVY